MSTGKTKHFGLHAWAPGDDFLRAEFNENFAAIDDQAVRVVLGTYVGTGDGTQHIALGFTPRAVLVGSGEGSKQGHVVGLALDGFPLTRDGVAIEAGGFRAHFGIYSSGESIPFNAQGEMFRYIAVR